MKNSHQPFVGEGFKPSPTAAEQSEPFDLPRRKSTRLPGYDYATPGAYFITTCTDGFRCIFGDIENGVWQPNHFGKIVENCWLELLDHYRAIMLDEYCVMPNHFHGLLHLQEGAPSLLEAIRGFKSFSARQINAARHASGTKVWQRSFHDRVVRSEADLQRIRQYIFDNPGNWTQKHHIPAL